MRNFQELVGLHIRSFALLGSLCIALLDKLVGDGGYEIGWDRKTDPIGGCVRLRIDCSQCWDTDELPLQIDQGSATIAGIHSGIGLDTMGDRGSG